MRLRSVLLPLALIGGLSLGAVSTASAADEAMLALFKILRDRGSISDEECQQLTKMSKKEEAAAPGKVSSATRIDGSAMEALDRMEARISEGEKRLAHMEKAAPVDKGGPSILGMKLTDKWYEKLKIDGYTQFRLNTGLDDEADYLNVPADRSVNEDESLIIRRGRFKITGDISKHLFLYSQFDFAGTVFGSGGSFGLQARDLYGDIGFDDAFRYRVRLGLSKVPFGFVNMQSSQNRGPLERPDAINSAFEGERDQGAYFMYTPVEVRERFKELTKSGLRGSGDYGMFTVGAIAGQGLNRSDRNGEPHVVARLTYPWKLPNGQFFEASVQGYHGKYVVSTDSIDVEGVETEPFSSDNGVTDERVGVSAILYPQPFGIEAEWNWGRGPELSDDRQSIGVGNLQGGYIMANYQVKTDKGLWFPFVRWHYYDGARKFATNAPRDKVNEIDFGLEWSPLPEIELTLQYTHTLKRTDTTSYPYPDIEDADRLGIQVQWNY